MNFKIVARKSTGEQVYETIEAETKAQVIMMMRERGLTLIEVKESNDINLFQRKKVNLKELALFCKQLSYLLNTGISMLRSIELIETQVKNKYFKEVLKTIINSINAGSSLSKSLEKYQDVFPEMFIYQLKSAEAGGFMEEILLDLANDLEREVKFKGEIKSAMIYPISVIVFSLGVVYFMMAFIVPKLSGTLMNFNAELPALTLTIISISEFVQKYWYFGVIATILGIFIYKNSMKDKEKKLKFDLFILKTPLIGEIVKTINIARMSRTMSSLLGSGVPIDETLDNLAKILTNSYMGETIKKVNDDVVKRGISLSQSLERQQFFPPTLIQIVTIGEETGSLPKVLRSLAEQYEEEVAISLKRITSMINPILMVFVGIIVGTVILSLFMPMFSLIETF